MMRAPLVVAIAGVCAAAGACGRIGFDAGVSPEEAEESRAAFSVGQGFACAIRGEGEVWCWGENLNGQLASDAVSPVLRPTRAQGVPPARQVAAATYHACTVALDGAVWCWGGDDHDRLGYPTVGTALLAVPGGPATGPRRVALPEPALEVGVAIDHTCALLESGAVWCWGRNDLGQLGRGAATPDELPDAVPGVSDALHLSIADDSSCVVRRTGTVACWGENNAHQIDPTGENVLSALDVAGIAGATGVALGGDHVCALVGGRIACRGTNVYGTLGDGTRDPRPDEVVVSTDDDFVQVVAAFSHTCGLRADRTGACWGANEDNVLGAGTEDQRLVPTTIAGLGDAVALATHERATCALAGDGSLACWGWGARGLVGDGRSATLAAAPAMTVTNVSMLATGRDHTCASNGADVWCWGSNRYGQLGLGTIGDAQPTPQRLTFAFGAAIAQLVVGNHHTCVRTAMGEVYCWGLDESGQIGDDGDDAPQAEPVRVTLPSARDVAAGSDHTCALTPNNELYCWGRNYEMQLGDGTMDQHSVPVSIANAVDAVALGANHGCLLRGVTVSCWGSNVAGQLGDGTLDSHAIPTQVASFDASALAAGGDSTCARLPSTTVACWGANENNLLDAPTAVMAQTRPAPSQQTALFAIGGRTACSSAGCWGDNALGQVGMGGFDYVADPRPTAGLPSPATVRAVSGTHACAIVDTTVYCWGENAHGEIGDGTRSTATSPVPVAF